MSQDFDLNTELAPDVFDFDEYYPEEAWDALAETNDLSEKTDAAAAEVGRVSNDEFLTAIFGNTFTSAHPLVCKKPSDPDLGGWVANKWPCNTNASDLNWYALPGLYQPDDTGRYRAKKELAVSVHAVMVDDVGTKVSADHFANCPPSWAIETSPGNCQYGYILIEPITDLSVTDNLKEKLIEAGLCDSGATGGTARWMRMPVAINGRPKYGEPSPRCRLTQWRPELKYSVENLYAALGLNLHKPVLPTKNAASPNQSLPPSLMINDANSVIEALQTQGLYKTELGTGKHDITCPWVHGHTDSIDNGTVYFEPSVQFPSGGFKCHHSHGHLFHIRELKEFLGLEVESVEQPALAQPQKLPAALHPVLKLDSTYLPEVMRDAVLDLTDRLQCPPDYLAVAMLSAAGAVIGNKVGIFPYANDESWEVYPALWGGIVGDPGSKKSPSLLHAHKPLQHLEGLASQKYAQDMKLFEQAKVQHEQAVAAWSKNKKSGLKPTPPVEPKRERYVVHDSTYQALGVILADNPRGVLALADELSGLLQSLDTAGQEAARGFYLTGWSGTGGYSFDRVGRGSITLDRYCLSVFGGFQPDRIKAYVQFTQRGSSKNDGLLQRFQLLVWPDSVGNFQFVDRVPDKAAISKYQQAVIKLPVLADIVGEFNDEDREMHFVPPQAEKLFHLIEQGQMTAPLNAEIHTGELDWQSHPPAVKKLGEALSIPVHVVPSAGHGLPKEYVAKVLDKALNKG